MEKLFDLTKMPTFDNIDEKMPSTFEINNFKSKISDLINLDLNNYKNNQLERRIVSYMYKSGINDLNSYFTYLKNDQRKLADFVNMITINVSEFFRNHEKFLELERTYLPELLKKNDYLRIWSAGCSIGAEIYSVAMILDRLKALDKAQLIASDFDRNIIKRAKTGIYTKQELAAMPQEYYRYFKPLDKINEKFELDFKILSKVRFEERDLLKGVYEKNFDLIICRNVLIYFTKEANEQIYSKFYDSLVPGGILFIGSSERVYDSGKRIFKVRTPFFYQK